MEKVGIEINLMNGDEVRKTLESIEAGTRRLGAKKTVIQLEDGSLTTVEKRIKKINDDLAVLKAKKGLSDSDKEKLDEYYALGKKQDELYSKLDFKNIFD